ncbi:MAG: ABC transporter permease [Myxococcales bacterium]|nr:ABC transporter permease [Myxococcales bacterium]MBL0194585.1 ABC transporter permease [Myxococcales bacterium]HQY63300.1 ABC transporter permease [Polyangiaceae bacterium]
MAEGAAKRLSLGRRSLGAALAFARRVSGSLVVVLALATAVFLSLRLLPGDPAALVLGDLAGPDERAVLRARLSLDQPLYVQYALFLRRLVTLDLGDSLRRPGTSVRSALAAALGPTASLALVAVLLGAALGVGLAVLASGPWLGRGRRHVERLLVVCASTPLLAFAPLLTFVLSAKLRLVPLPGDPEAGAAGLLFASSLLSVPLFAHVGRITRASLKDLERAQFLTVARAKGASGARVWLLHAVPACVGPIATVVGTQLGALLGGAVVLERLFERPGLGSLILEAYATRDLPVLEAAVVLTGALFVVAQAGAQAVHGAVDPRVLR